MKFRTVIARNCIGRSSQPSLSRDRWRAQGISCACHEHPPGEEAYCVGWLMNQIGPGNNIPLRFAVLSCENLGAISLEGLQHERFEDTLPKATV